MSHKNDIILYLIVIYIACFDRIKLILHVYLFIYEVYDLRLQTSVVRTWLALCPPSSVSCAPDGPRTMASAITHPNNDPLVP